jgi:hypothetical protein
MRQAWAKPRAAAATTTAVKTPTRAGKRTLSFTGYVQHEIASTSSDPPDRFPADVLNFAEIFRYNFILEIFKNSEGAIHAVYD